MRELNCFFPDRVIGGFNTRWCKSLYDFERFLSNEMDQVLRTASSYPPYSQ